MFLVVLAIIVLLLGGYATGRVCLGRNYERRVRRWCDQNGYALLDFRHRRIVEGVWYYLRFHPPGERKWRTTVQDGEGGRLSGWVRFGPWWWVDVPWGSVDVRRE